MKLVDQTATLVEQDLTFEGLLKHIEKCGRVCYKSEDRISENSAYEFVTMLLKNKHCSPLEHGMVWDFYTTKHDSKFVKTYSIDEGLNRKVSVSNLRWLMEVSIPDKQKVLDYVKGSIPDKVPPKNTRRVTFHVITSRGTLDEILRHRVLSASVESTRFCNYTKGKFNGELTFVKPTDYEFWSRIQQVHFDTNCKDTQLMYDNMIKDGLKPQQARSVLPLSIKSEAYLTAFVDDWVDICNKRIIPAAHPDARDLCQQIYNQLKDNEYLKE